jgi:hypothetical protein
VVSGIATSESWGCRQSGYICTIVQRMTSIYPVTVRFPENEREQLRILAEAEHRSISNMLHVLVVEALAAREAKAAQK